MPASKPFGGRVVGFIDESVRGLGNRLAAVSPRLKRWLQAAREFYVETYIRGIALTNAIQYAAPPDPHGILWVDPDKIEYLVEFSVSKFRLAGVVRCGDWDRTTVRFEELEIYRSFRRHFEDDIPWEETAFFDQVIDQIERGRQPWGCDSRDEFEVRCRRLDRLYETIRTSGYRTQAELCRSNHPNLIGRPIHPKKRLRDEIAVHIGRDGSLLFEDGRNRLAIAKLLDLDAVPVRVLLRHCEWQKVRDAYARDELDESSSYVSHPDIRSLADGDR